MATIELDLKTITLGEALAVEAASGQDFAKLIGRQTSRNVVALFIHESRTSAEPRSWPELCALRIYDEPFSTSPSTPDGPPARSNA